MTFCKMKMRIFNIRQLKTAKDISCLYHYYMQPVRFCVRDSKCVHSATVKIEEYL